MRQPVRTLAMLHVAVVGDHGSGKATFLGLVYATLVRSGAGRDDALRFHVAYESLDEITGLYQPLMSGSFPDVAAKEGVRELTVEVGGPVAKAGLLHRRSAGNAGASAVLRFTLPGSLEEATAGLNRGATFGTGAWRDALDADVLVVLVDGTKLLAGPADPPSAPLAGCDGRVTALLVAIQRWRSSGGRSTLHPVFVVSKFDAIPGAALQAAKLEPGPPEVRKSGARAAYAKALLEPNLPRTWAALSGPTGKKLRFAEPNYVFSRVRTEAKGSPPQKAIRLRRVEGGGWEPDYASDEYVAFLEHVARIAAATKE